MRETRKRVKSVIGVHGMQINLYETVQAKRKRPERKVPMGVNRKSDGLNDEKIIWLYDSRIGKE